MSKLILGIGHRDGARVSFANTDGQGRYIDPLYNAWKSALAHIKKYDLEATQCVLHYPIFKKHLEMQGFKQRKHYVRCIANSLRVNGDPVKKVGLSEFLVLERYHAQNTIDRYRKRSLPLWVHHYANAHNPYQAKVMVVDKKHYERCGHGLMRSEMGKDPDELHFWALNKKIESYQAMLNFYPDTGSTRVAHMGIKRIIDTLTSHITFRKHYIAAD